MPNGMRVLLDGTPMPLLYSSRTQINAVVPVEVHGPVVHIELVDTTGAHTDLGQWRVREAAPVILTGSAGRGGAIRN